MKRKIIVFFTSVVFLSMSAGAADKQKQIPKKPGGVVAVLNEPTMPVRGAASSPEAIAKILVAAGIKAELISADQLADPAVLNISRFDLVILPTGQSFPGAARRTFLDYLQSGGGFVSMGGYAFSNLLVEHKGRWVKEAKVVDEKVREAIATDATLLADGGFEKVQEVPLRKSPGGTSWYRTNTRCGVVAEDPRSGRFCAKVEVPPGGAQASTEFRAQLVPEPGMVYHASGWLKTRDITPGPGSSRLAYLAVYQFGQDDKLVAFKHFALVRGTTDWKQYDLNFAADRRAKRIELRSGIYRAGGTAWFDDLHLVRIPGVSLGPMNTAEGQAANLLKISPEQIGVFDASYPLKRACALRPAPGQRVIGRPLEIRRPLAGWAASGVVGTSENTGYTTLDGKLVVNARWVPILETLDRYGRPRGPAGAMMLNYDGTYSGSNWAYFGIENVDLFRDPAGPMAGVLQDVVRFLVRGTYLRNAATNWRFYRKGEPIQASVIVENRGASAQEANVCFSLTAVGADKPAITTSRTVTIGLGACRQVETSLGQADAGTDLYRVDIVLQVAGRAIDELTTGFVVDRPDVVASGSELRFEDNYFTLNGRPVFLFGSDESAHVYLAPQENPLTWAEDLLAARDVGMNVYENLHYSCPGHDLTERDWRDFRAMRQLTQKYDMVFMPGMLIKGGVAADAATQAKQAAHCAAYAKNLGDTPGYIYYINGDYEVHLGEHLADITKRWNNWLKQRYQTTDRLRAAWGAENVKAEIGSLDFPPRYSRRWDDVIAIDYIRFRTEVTRRWNQGNVDAVRKHDTRHPTTSEYQMGNPVGMDVHMTIAGQDVSNFGGFGSYTTRWFDLRARGKGVSIGEYGMRLHPAWTGEGGPSRGYSMARSEEVQKLMFLQVGHSSFGQGVSKIQNWCLRDAQSRSVFPWGVFYPEQMIPKDVAYVHRNQSIIFRHFAPKYVAPRLTVCIPDNMGLGNPPKFGMAVACRAFQTLFDLHYDFNVIDDHHFDQLPAETKVIVYPAPMAVRDDVYARLVEWVKSGGTLFVTGDFSYDADRQRTRTKRLKELAGAQFISEQYPNIARPTGSDVQVTVSLDKPVQLAARPCIRIKPLEAEVLGRTADGQPVLVRHTLGRGTVYYFTDPVELAEGNAADAARRTIYRKILRATPAKPLGIEPDEFWLHVLAQPTATGLVHVVSNRHARNTVDVVKIPTAAGQIELQTRGGWPALVMATDDGKVLAVGADGRARAGQTPLASGAGCKALLALDGKDLRGSQAILVAPFESGTLEQTRPAVAIVGEFQNGKWTPLERITLDDKRSPLAIDADRATCLILICPPGSESQWAMRLTQAVLHPEQIDAY